MNIAKFAAAIFVYIAAALMYKFLPWKLDTSIIYIFKNRMYIIEVSNFQSKNIKFILNNIFTMHILR